MNRLKLLLTAFLLAAPFRAAFAFNAFECLRELIPVTDRASFSGKRKQVEAPFFSNENYIVFPEVNEGRVTGFFMYSRSGAWYYDSVQTKNKKIEKISELQFKSDKGVFELVTQPTGLETVAVNVLPGFLPDQSNRSGPVVLGASVLPVVGAFVSRPAVVKVVYHNPSAANEEVVKQWIAENSPGRRPANVGDVKINRTIARLTTQEPKSPERLYEPLNEELRLRKSWVQSRNLDESTFIDLSRVLDGSCKGQ